KNVLWLSGSNGLAAFYMSTKKFSTYDLENKHDNNRFANMTYGLFFDKEDGLWISGDIGLSRYDKHQQLFTNYNPYDQAKRSGERDIDQLYPDPADTTGNSVWISTSSGNYIFNLQSNTVAEFPVWMSRELPLKESLLFYRGS